MKYLPPKASNLEFNLVYTLDIYQLETMVATSSTPQQPFKNCTKVWPTDIRLIPKIDVMQMSTRKIKTQRLEVLKWVENIQFEKMKNAERKIKNTWAKHTTRKSLNLESTKKKHQMTPLNIFIPYVENNMCGPGAVLPDIR